MYSSFGGKLHEKLKPAVVLTLICTHSLSPIVVAAVQPGAAGARAASGAQRHYPPHPAYPHAAGAAGAGAAGDPHFQSHPRSMLDRAAVSSSSHQGVLSGGYGGGYPGAVGVQDNGWGGRPPVHSGSSGAGGAGGGGAMYRGMEDGGVHGVAGGQAYSQQQQRLLQQHQAQYQMPQQYPMHQPPQHHHQEDQRLQQRLNTPEGGAGGAAAMWAGGAGAAAGWSEGGPLIESPMPSFMGRFAEGMESPMGDGVRVVLCSDVGLCLSPFSL